MLLKLRFAENKHEFCVFSRHPRADFSSMSGGWLSLHGGFPGNNSTRTSKFDSLLKHAVHFVLERQRLDMQIG
jgi:hypothetical protein